MKRSSRKDQETADLFAHRSAEDKEPKSHGPGGPELTLRVECSNCGARFVAYYGSDRENEETILVEACGLCEGDQFAKGRLADATIRLIPQITSRRPHD